MSRKVKEEKKSSYKKLKFNKEDKRTMVIGNALTN
ncbi:MAG: hypothetical protein K0R00_2797 [Herbinix sp.]|nr:hypothetical protein [Herbinix sp.]